MSYFPEWPEYDFGTDADHLPVVPADSFPQDTTPQPTIDDPKELKL